MCSEFLLPLSATRGPALVRVTQFVKNSLFEQTLCYVTTDIMYSNGSLQYRQYVQQWQPTIQLLEEGGVKYTALNYVPSLAISFTD